MKPTIPAGAGVRQSRVNPMLSATMAAIGALYSGASIGQAVGGQAESPAPAEVQGVQEIVISAQKRAEPLSRAPIAVTALTGEDLRTAGVTSTAELTNVAPNVQIGTADSGNTNIYIRGIGSSNNAEAGDAAAAFHVDGVYLSRPRSARGVFFDVERIEVLRGPQGTLYGRNATAGAVNVITRKPAFGKLSGEVQAEVGNYSLQRGEFAVNVPVSDQFALRVAGMGSQEGNYVQTAYADNERHTAAGRLQALWKISPTVSLLIGADTAHFQGAINAGVVAPLVADRGDAGRINLNALGSSSDGREQGASAELTWDLGDMTLTYLGASRSSRVTDSEDLKLTATLTEHRGGRRHAEQISHELRLTSSSTGAFKWVGGLYAFSEKQDTLSFFAGGLLGFDLPDIRSESQAVFGQGTYSLTQDLRATVGLRYTHDNKSAVNGRSTNAFPTLSGGPLLVGNTNFDRSWSKTNGRAGLEYDLAKGSMLYATLATGYKAGGFNNAQPTAPNAPPIPAAGYNPENLVSVEGGVKTRLLDGRATLNVAAFKYSYKDLQLSSIVDNGAGGVISRIVNAGKASVSGLEAESRLRIGAAGRLDASIGVTRARYDDYDACVNEVTGAAALCTGNALRNAPKLQLGLAYEHAIPVGDAQVSLRVATRYSSPYFNDDINSATFKQDAYTKTDLSARYESADDTWWAQAYVRNIEDRNVKSSRYPAVIAGQSYAYLASPRTFGVSAGFRF